jgi:peptidoglycan/LPS O-acetylase OafA/YrhL
VDETLRVDVLLTWMGALGVFVYLGHIQRSAAKSFLESRTRLLLLCLGALLLVRGFAWLEPSRLLRTLTFLPAALLPLAATLFVEALLRRHVPLGMKLWVAAGTVVVFVANLFGVRTWNVGLLVFMAATFAFLVVLLVRRRRSTLSPPENRLVDAVLLAMLAAVPLTVTDFRVDLGLPWNRMGALGALVFVYTLVRMSSRRDGERITWRELATIAVWAALLGGLMLALVREPTVPRAVHALSLGFGFVLLFAVCDGLRQLRAQGRARSFLRWLLEAKTSSASDFLAALADCPVAEEHVTLGSAELQGHDVKALVRRLDGGRCVVRLSELRSAAAIDVAERAGEELEVDEQLADLLETYGMTHLCLVTASPPLLLLVNYPQLADAAAHELEMALVQKLGRLVPPQEAPVG